MKQDLSHRNATEKTPRVAFENHQIGVNISITFTVRICIQYQRHRTDTVEHFIDVVFIFIH